MALVLALKKGQSFYVSDERFDVDRVDSEVDFHIVCVRTGDSFHITDRKSVEIMPEVFVSAGDRQQLTMARIAIEAPRRIPIFRGDVYDPVRKVGSG